MQRALTAGWVDRPPLAWQAAEAEEIDWEVVDIPAVVAKGGAAAAAAAAGAAARRAVRVTLEKEAPGHNVVFWWRRALLSGPEVEVAALSDRQRYSARSEGARRAWADAETEFRKIVAARAAAGPIEIDVSGGCDDDDAEECPA